MKALLKTALLAAGMAIAVPASASSIYLDFEGIAPYPSSNDVLIEDFYNGGTSSIGTSGTNYGVSFTEGGTLLCLNTEGTNCSNTSRGGLGIPTSQKGALYFPNVNPTMNVSAGFDTGFSFVYSDPFAVGSTISIYSGLNGTGDLLASETLPGTPAGACDGAISSGATYCPFVAFSLGFSGTAQSVVFGGSTNSQVFDDFTFGSVEVGGGVPEPATWATLIGGVAVTGGALRRRRTSTTVRYA